MYLYDKQREIAYSVRDNDETYVPAGNQLGKDFVAGFLAIWYFMLYEEVRVITTSVKDDHLRVLWGEIGRFIDTAVHPLSVTKGGPWIINHREIRKVVNGEVCKISYLKGMVSMKGEGMAGHHAPHTLIIGDEASGIDDLVYTQSDTWAKSKLLIGNPNPCTNFFFHAVEEGDVKSPTGSNYFRKVIKIKAQDSPSVILSELQIANGKEPTHEILVPGVVDYNTYIKHRELWDVVRQTIGLDAEFYKGAEVLLYPPDWLNRSEDFNPGQTAQTIGVDPAEGGDNTCWSVVGQNGLIELISMKTPDTTLITSRTIALMSQHRVPAEKVYFDRGGGGKEHADRLRKQGHNVNTVAFGEGATPELKRGRTQFNIKKEEVEEHYVYKNRRAEMYGMLRHRLNPVNDFTFALPARYTELRRQLALMPYRLDDEGRMWLPPKNKKSKIQEDNKEETLIKILGCSPDEADSLVLAVYGMDTKATRSRVRVF